MVVSICAPLTQVMLSMSPKESMTPSVMLLNELLGDIFNILTLHLGRSSIRIINYIFLVKQILNIFNIFMYYFHLVQILMTHSLMSMANATRI